MLAVKNLSKKYPSFELKNVSFDLAEGYIMGFIGMNGAGKSTTLKSMLNITHPDGGTVEIFGKDMKANEIELKQEIGFMLGGINFYTKKSVRTLADVYSRFFDAWDDNLFQTYLKRFAIDPRKQIRELSAGMKVKLGIAMALSHGAKLLIFDEPTSGLDPVAREDLLDLFQEIVEDGTRSILFSTHITSDLDKCADYIIFIRNGELIANSTKDDLIDCHALVEGKTEDLSENLKSRLISLKKNAYGFSGLIRRDRLQKSDAVRIETPNLEDLMVYYNREGAK